MKSIKLSLLILALCGLVLSSCKKSSNPAPAAAVSMSLTFNGTAKNTNVVVATYYTSENTLQLIGTFNTEAVSIMIQNIQTGTFTLPSDNVLATYSTANNFADTYLGSTGSITITSFTSDAVSGTFQFTGTNTSNANGVVTGGKFSAKLIKVAQQQ
jgi:hypothetical protein